MISLLPEAIDKLQAHHNRVILDAVTDCAVQFEEMGKRSSDTLYSEPARQWRQIEHKIQTAKKDNTKISNALTDNELEWVIAAYLWCSTNNDTTCFR